MTPTKLLITYDIAQETSDEYRQFVMEKFLPQAQEMGLVIAGVWYTAYGEGPERHTEFVTRDEEAMWSILYSAQWQELEQELKKFVTDFDRKVLPYKPGFQL